MNSTKYLLIFFVFIVMTLIIGLCVGFFVGLASSKDNPVLLESISLIEQGNALFSDVDKTTWMPSLTAFQKAKELTDQHELKLPDMEPRIKQLQEKIEYAIKQGIETAKFFYDGGSPSMAITTLENEVLKIAPEHEEGNKLKIEYLNELGIKN